MIKFILLMILSVSSAMAEITVTHGDVSYTATGETYDRLTTTFKVYTTDVDLAFTINGEEYVVPAGFRTDLGTVPMEFRSFVTPKSIDTASIIHDYLYFIGYDRPSADKVFAEVLKETHSPFFVSIISIGQTLTALLFNSHDVNKPRPY